MSAIDKAIQDVRFAIPTEVLNEVFLKKEFGRSPLPVSLETMIREKVIEPRVMADCKLLGGTQVELPLDSVRPEPIEHNKIVYRIPKALTQNRTISRVLSITIGRASSINGAFMGMQGYSQILAAANGMMSAQASIPIVSTAYVRLIAENTILVGDYLTLPQSAYLRCYLEADDEYSQLNPTTYPHFSQLVELAIKAYIYANAIIPIGQAQLSGGMELGRFREIVDSYSDSYQMYKDFIVEKWTKVMLMDDPRSKERHLRTLVGGNN